MTLFSPRHSKAHTPSIATQIPPVHLMETQHMLGKPTIQHRLTSPRRPQSPSGRPYLYMLEARQLLTRFLTQSPAYLPPVAIGVSTTPLLTTGDLVGRTCSAFQQYRMVGIPDG